MPGFVSNTVQVHIAAIEPDSGQLKFLVLKRSAQVMPYPSIWQVVTGTMEAGETALRTALREVKEETSLEPLKVWTVPYMAMFFDAGADQINVSPVFGILVDFATPVILSQEHCQYCWVDYPLCLEILFLPSHKNGTRIFYDYILNNNYSDSFLVDR